MLFILCVSVDHGKKAENNKNQTKWANMYFSKLKGILGC